MTSEITHGAPLPEPPGTSEPAGPPGSLRELAGLFLKLGLVAFGGPAAHIAMMEEEVVARRRWMSREHFLDLVGATNLIPGPNSTEMTMHVGYERAGGVGLLVAGTAFIFPAVLITGVLAWAYVELGSLPEVAPLLFGVKPAVIAVILGALWRLGKTAVKGWLFAGLGVLVAIAVLAGVGEITALLSGGFIGALALRGFGRGSTTTANSVIPILLLASPASFSTWKLLFFFLKVGAVLYGSGYVLIAFLEGGLVQDLGWLTQGQLMDAVAVGQFTPGPLLSTATFIGYVVDEVPGAVVATLGIFLPSFVFVLFLNPFIPRMRRSAWLSAFLDSVNVAAVALMAAVTIQLGMGTLTSWPAWLIAGLSAILAVRFRLNAAWLVLGGAVLGWFLIPWAG
jgi:chromate transporter